MNRAQDIARKVRAAKRHRDNHDAPLHQIRLVRPGSLRGIDHRRVEGPPRQEESFRPATLGRTLICVMLALGIAVGVGLAVRAAL